MNDLVIVTGASRGVGLSVMSHLVELGYRVHGLSRTCSAELQELIDRSDDATWSSFDLGDLGAIQATVAEIIAEHGAPYGLVNNAAIGNDGLLATQHDSEILELINVNIAGTVLLTKYAARAMLPKRRGRVVNISSVTALTGYSGLAVYGATKAALIGFTKSLAREMGRANVTVNTIAPGYMETDMTAGLDEAKLATIRRRGALPVLVEPTDVAMTVGHLLGEAGRRITGSTIVLDAGNSA